MMLNCSSVFVQWRPCSRTNTVCLASHSATAVHLRQQLDNLHKEADDTRAKANNARSRLLRLSEAVEKIRQQAAVSVQTGRENDARDLLFQKKKVMQAMEKLKSRIELFDELSAKLNEAISMKENLLIGNFELDDEVSETEAPTSVRIVSPTEETPDNADDIQKLDNLEFLEDRELQVISESEDIHAENKLNSYKETSSIKGSHDANNFQGLKEISTYEDFLKHLDLQLNKIEEELESFLRFSSFLLESKEKLEYSKVQHVSEILAGVRHTRERIATIKRNQKSL